MELQDHRSLEAGVGRKAEVTGSRSPAGPVIEVVDLDDHCPKTPPSSLLSRPRTEHRQIRVLHLSAFSSNRTLGSPCTPLIRLRADIKPRFPSSSFLRTIWRQDPHVQTLFYAWHPAVQGFSSRFAPAIVIDSYRLRLAGRLEFF